MCSCVAPCEVTQNCGLFMADDCFTGLAICPIMGAGLFLGDQVPSPGGFCCTSGFEFSFFLYCPRLSAHIIFRPKSGGGQGTKGFPNNIATKLFGPLVPPQRLPILIAFLHLLPGVEILQCAMARQKDGPDGRRIDARLAVILWVLGRRPRCTLRPRSHNAGPLLRPAKLPAFV